MRLFEISTFFTVVIDFVAWFAIHMSVAQIILRVSKDFFNCNQWLYKERKWEDGGDFYQRIFRIKKWKQFLPDGAEFSKNKGFPKKHLRSKAPEYLEAFSIETCRAELTHWITMLFAPLFFLWNFFFVGWIMIFYALITNIPFIIVQRYNRFRLIRILNNLRQSSEPHTKTKSSHTYVNANFNSKIVLMGSSSNTSCVHLNGVTIPCIR